MTEKFLLSRHGCDGCPECRKAEECLIAMFTSKDSAPAYQPIDPVTSGRKI